MTENTKLLRIESVTDKALSKLIQLPAPFTALVVAAWSALCFAAGVLLL